jgi:hypothetical protein
MHGLNVPGRTKAIGKNLFDAGLPDGIISKQKYRFV